MTLGRKSAAELLQDAKLAEPRESLREHQETIVTLRAKNYSWREIAEFLTKGGVETDHTKVFRFMQKRGSKKMKSPELFTVPSAERYAAALTEIAGEITDKQRTMLEHHYRAHNRTVTYGELRRAAGWKGGAKLWYGKLGSLLGEKLEMTFAKLDDRNPESESYYSSAIGSGSEYPTADGEFQLVMHHELAKALDQLGWFKD